MSLTHIHTYRHYNACEDLYKLLSFSNPSLWMFISPARSRLWYFPSIKCCNQRAATVYVQGYSQNYYYMYKLLNWTSVPHDHSVTLSNRLRDLMFPKMNYANTFQISGLLEGNHKLGRISLIYQTYEDMNHLKYGIKRIETTKLFGWRENSIKDTWRKSRTRLGF